MTTALWISAIIGTLALAGNLINGYLQRKQMRQNELFRKDASVGLIPPPHPVRAHLRKYRSLYWNVGCSAYFLIAGFRGQGPLTRTSALEISIGVCFFFYAGISFIEDKVISLLERIANIITKIAEVQGLTRDVLKTVVKELDSTEETPK